MNTFCYQLKVPIKHDFLRFLVQTLNIKSKYGIWPTYFFPGLIDLFVCDLSTEEKSQKDQVVTASKPSIQLLT